MGEGRWAQMGEGRWAQGEGQLVQEINRIQRLETSPEDFGHSCDDDGKKWQTIHFATEQDAIQEKSNVEQFIVENGYTWSHTCCLGTGFMFYK